VTTPSPTSAPPWPARLLAVAAAGALAVTLAHPSATRQFTWPWLPGLTLAWIVPIFALLCFRTPWRTPGRLLTAGLLLLALGTFVAAALSPFAPLSLPRVWPTLGGIALFFWLHQWLAEPAGSDRARHLMLGLTLGGAVLAVVSLVGWRWQTAGGPWSVRNDHPFGHSNYTAGAMLLVLPWLAHASWQTRGLRRFAWRLALLVALLALLTTSSRAGVAALGATGALLVGFALIRASWTRRVKLLVALAAAAVLCLVVIANPRLRELALGGGWSEVARESNTQRSAMLEAGLRLGAARPFTGWGPGAVPLTYPNVRAQLSGGVDNVLQLHNTPVQLWATLGAPGLLALCLLLAAAVRRFAVVSRTPTPTWVTAASSLLAYGLFALTDHQLDLPVFNVLLVINLALLFQGSSATAPTLTFPRRTATWLMIAALLVPLWLTVRDLGARHAYELALDDFAAGRTESGQAHLAAAAARAPADPYYRHQLAGSLLRQRTASSDAATRDRLGAAAAEQLRLSLAAGCFQEYAHFNLAWLALESGAPRLAAVHFRATLAQAPHRGGAYFGLGLALRALQEHAAAVRAFALEWINDPSAATSPLWDHPDFALFRPSVVREANAILAELGPTHPSAGGIDDLWRWWQAGGTPPAHGCTVEGTDFIAALAAMEQHAPLPSGSASYPWGRLLQIWQQTPADFSAVSPRDPAFADTLARRAGRHPAPDVHGFLTAGPEGETNLLVETWPARTGYGVLALHPDGPVLTDLYVKPSHRLVSTFASTVFPPKGWLPARELLARLPAIPAAP
jgi:O-antigen ligase